MEPLKKSLLYDELIDVQDDLFRQDELFRKFHQLLCDHGIEQIVFFNVGSLWDVTKDIYVTQMCFNKYILTFPHIVQNSSQAQFAINGTRVFSKTQIDFYFVKYVPYFGFLELLFNRTNDGKYNQLF